MKKIIKEKEFKIKLKQKLSNINVKSVTGPGRSGAIASVYASYLLKVPYIPYGHKCPSRLLPILIIDTASQSGKTLRKSKKRYYKESVILYIYKEPPRVHFWYENI